MKLYDISGWCKHGLEVTDYPYIGEVDIDIADYEFGTPVQVGDSCYAISVLSRSINSAGVRKIDISEEPEECNYEDNITCPYCGHQNTDSWECDDSDDEYTCDRCQGVFSYERVITIEYNSYPKRPPEPICGKWA